MHACLAGRKSIVPLHSMQVVGTTGHEPTSPLCTESTDHSIPPLFHTTPHPSPSPRAPTRIAAGQPPMVTAGIISRLVSVPPSPPLALLLSPQLASPHLLPHCQLSAAPPASPPASPPDAAAAGRSCPEDSSSGSHPEGSSRGNGSGSGRGELPPGRQGALERSGGGRAAESQAGSRAVLPVAVMLQSTAAVFGGQSGGVMVDAEGRMIGLVTRWVEGGRGRGLGL